METNLNTGTYNWGRSELDRLKTIKELEKLASEVIRLKQERDLRRPLLIEFCGSPKSGKSTTITSLNILLKRNGFRTEVLLERSSICPVNNKTHPFFNIWTMTSAISEIIKHLDMGKDRVDVIISDRGIFDALCWFEWLSINPQKGNPYLDETSYNDLKKFILMDFWKDYLDLIYVFQVAPETSIKREYANLLTDQRGSIMRENVLDGFNTAINNVMKQYGGKFRKIIKIETDTKDYNDMPNIVSYKVTHNILKTLKDLLIEKIAFFDSTYKRQLVSGINKINRIESWVIKYDNRDKVESKDFIQPIVIAIITDKERKKVLVVKKSPKRTPANSPESEKLLLYIGGHIRLEDEQGDGNYTTFQKALHREIQEEIGESITIKNNHPFMIYTPDNEKSARHVAVCYIIEMDLEEKKFKLTSDEFIMKTGTSKSGQILGIKELLKGNFKLESWSKYILKEVFNVDAKDKDLFEKDWDIL